MWAGLYLFVFFLMSVDVRVCASPGSIVIWVTNRGFPGNTSIDLLNDECGMDAEDNEISGDIFAFKCYPFLTNLKQIITPNTEIINTRNERVYFNSSTMFGPMKGIIYYADQTELNRRIRLFVRTGADDDGVCSEANNCGNWTSEDVSLNANAGWLVGGVAGSQMFSSIKNVLSCSLDLPIFCVAITTASPTSSPTASPTASIPPTSPTPPSRAPTSYPTRPPTKPTRSPTSRPSKRPSTVRPSTSKPPTKPTKSPTVKPTKKPTLFPTTRPSKKPTIHPTAHPTKPTKSPTSRRTKDAMDIEESDGLSQLSPTPKNPTSIPSTRSPTFPPSTHRPTSRAPTDVI